MIYKTKQQSYIIEVTAVNRAQKSQTKQFFKGAFKVPCKPQHYPKQSTEYSKGLQAT